MQEAASAFTLLLQLGRRARQAENESTLGFVVVNESRQLVQFRQSAVWILDQGIKAVSGLASPETDAPYTQWLHTLCKHLPAQPGYLLLNNQSLPADIPASIASEWDNWLPHHVLALPLRHAGGKVFGYWLLAREAEWSDADIAIAMELVDIYAHAWKLFLPRISWRDRLNELLGDRKRKKKILIAAIIFMLFPVHLTVLAPAEITPRDAFQVRAPLDGAVDRMHARPNQPVKAGDPLFDLDTTSLNTKLSVARKALETAAEEFRQSAQLAVSDDEKGRLELSQRKGRMEEKAAELSYSEQLLERVKVKAPRDGIAVYSDPADWIGKAVTTGERVMQIADPTQVEITIRLPVADAIDLDPDAPVTLYLTTSPQFSYDAKLNYMSYRADVSADSLLAYRLKAEFEEGETPPRLGLTGTAKVYGNWVPLLYYLLRRPLAAARQWIGW